MAELGVASGVAGLLSLVLDVIQVTSKYVKAVSSPVSIWYTDLSPPGAGVIAYWRFLTKQELIGSRYEEAPPNLPSMVFPDSFSLKLFDSAIRSTHLNMVKLLVERGVKNTAYRELNGRNPLHTAVFCKTPEILRFLLDQGFELGERDRKGYSPLDIAARSGTAEVIKFLITLPNFQALPDGGPTTPLHLIWSNDRLLKDYDPSIDDTFEDRFAALATEMRKQLPKTRTAIANLMLESGVDIDRIDDSGQSPIFHALSCGVQAVKMLLTHKARTNITDMNGDTLLHHATTPVRELDDRGRIQLASSNESSRLVETILDCGVPINAQNKDGDTALHLAAEHSDPLTVKTLLHRGADPSIVNKYKETPLCFIVARWTHDQETSEKKLKIFSLLFGTFELGTINAPSHKRPREAEFFTFKYPKSWDEWDSEYENAPSGSLLDLALLAGNEEIIEELTKRGALALSVKKRTQASVVV